ncbi:MAG TPA: MFS transporter, partial [Rhizomicrobium sp.]
MVNVANAELIEGPQEVSDAPPQMEGDFSRRKLKIVAGIIVGQSFGTSVLPYSALMLMLTPLTHQFGWTAAQFSWAVTFLFVAGAISLWPIGRIADKFGIRPVLLGGTLMVGLITLGMAFQTASLWQFYAYYALLGIFGSTGVTYTKVVAALFTQHRGKAMAILTAETTLARAGVPLAVNWLLLNEGWHTMYLAFGIVILACVPVLFFTLEEPGEYGTAGKFSWRRNKSATQDAAPPTPKPNLPGMTIQQALRDPVFWLSTLAAFIGLFVFNGMFPHIVPALVGKGFSQTTVVELQSSSILVALAGALIGGWAVDRFQTPKIAAPISFIASAGAILTLLVSPSFGGVPLLAAILILGSLSFSALFPMGNYFATRFFGLGSLTEIVSVQFMVTNIFAGLSAPLFGWIFDKTHSYNIVFIITAGLNLFVAVIWLVMPKYRFAANIGQAAAPKLS